MNAYLLAGGYSRRFGEDKTLFPIGGKPLILNLYGKVSKYFPTYVVAKDPKKYLLLGIENVIPDAFPEIQSPLVGIYTALNHSGEEWNLILSADLPLLCNRYLEFVKDFPYKDRFLGYVPVLGGKIHFTCGVYSKRLIPLLEEALKGGDLSVRQFLDRFHLWEEDFLKKQGVDRCCCFNLNRKEDLKRLKDCKGN